MPLFCFFSSEVVCVGILEVQHGMHILQAANREVTQRSDRGARTTKHDLLPKANFPRFFLLFNAPQIDTLADK